MNDEDLSAMLGPPEMTDAWLMKAATAAAAVARSRFPEQHQESALLRGLANTILAVFAKNADAALRIPFTGQAEGAVRRPEPHRLRGERR